MIYIVICAHISFVWFSIGKNCRRVIVAKEAKFGLHKFNFWSSRSATPASYEAFSHDNITNAEKQRVSSCRQRELNEHTMHQTSNDLHKQAENVNESFRIRIQEMIIAKTNLEENLNQVNLVIFVLVNNLPPPYTWSRAPSFR